MRSRLHWHNSDAALRTKDRGKVLILHTRIIVVKNEDLTLFVAAALGQLGLKENAGAAVRELLTLNPDFATRARELMRPQLFSDENVEMLLDGLRKAGLESVHSPVLAGSASLPTKRMVPVRVS
jgi:hypothetical protein